jgi:hypothetical protein
MRRLLLSLAVLAFFINPGIACSSSDEDSFAFGEADMQAAVEGQWQLGWTAPDGTQGTVTVQVAEAGAPSDGGAAVMRPAGQRRGLIRAAAACGSRTFVKAAGACIDSSRMDLRVAYVSGDSKYQIVPLSGSFNVGGLSFESGHMLLTLDQTTVTVTIRPDGRVLMTSGFGPDGQLAVTAMRLAP